MENALKPQTTEHILNAVQRAIVEKRSLEIRAGGTKRELGRPMLDVQTLDLSALDGIVYYEPAELVLSASAATPLKTIQTALVKENQHLAFEPPNFGELLDGSSETATLGGVIACNLAGPRRVQAGAARDHFLGFNAVSGRGELFKSGSRVVKNVTGFDLSKLMAGSYGTLAIMTEATVKVLPIPDKTRTVLVRWSKDGVYDHGGVKAMSEAMSSAYEVSGAAHLPAGVARLSAVDMVSETSRAVTVIRVEGPGPSVEHRCQRMRQLLSKYGEITELHTTNSIELWREIKNVDYFSHEFERHVWRLSVPPSQGSQVALKILSDNPGEVFYDWCGGLIWLALEPSDNANAEVVRRYVKEVGGHATLFRAPKEIRRKISVFEPLEAGIATITKRIKSGFDPSGILNPGRMYEGI